MTGATDFAKLVPGFDFLQGLMRSAGHVLPDMGKWIAPTLDPEELGKRIDQLKTVQVWLEQNARMLGATVQALEVQRMTLATLKSMNVPVADLGAALQARGPAASSPAPAASAPAAEPASARRRRPRAAAASANPGPGRAGEGAGAPLVDPMQWWGALTQQFSQLAAQAMKEGPVEAARSAAGSLAEAAVRAAQPAAAAAPAPEGAPAPAAPRAHAKTRAAAPRARKSKLT
ncbi:MAG: hypothetical protein RI988_1495 [Pseudomonadota bacterium]|jgi:hypothetical protein